jgi:hypothetical protein
MLSNFGLSGGGFSGGGFGRAPANDTAPLNQYAGAPQLGATAQQVGVKQYGDIWASSNCPSCDTNIRNMQSLINQAGDALRANTRVTVDGKVGAGTVNALSTVARTASSQGIALGATLLVYNTPEAVAKNADAISNTLAAIRGAVPATAPPAIPPATGSGTSITPAATNVTPDVYPPPGFQPAKPGFFSQKNLPFIVGGVILAVGIGAAVMIMRPGSPAAE